MITYTTSSIFDSDADALVNPVNTVGVMGAGLAKKFKERYPHIMPKYVAYCISGHLTVGTIQYDCEKKPVIINFPTKIHWRHKSELWNIEMSLGAFVKTYSKYDIQSVSFPMVGCGLGGLRWDNVKGMMEYYLSDLPIDVFIHEYKEK